MNVELGKEYRDTITGFEGVAVGRYEYLYGCIRVGLERADKDGKPEELAFDEQRLVCCETNETVETLASVGGPQSEGWKRT